MDIYKPKFEKPKITPAFRKIILRDWHTCIPTLTIRKPMAISRRAGPLLVSIGFDIGSGREYYKPGFCAHNLSSQLDFLAAIIREPLRNIKTQGQSLLTVRAHEKGDYIEAAERMKAQSLLPLDKPISLKMIINVYKKYVDADRELTIDLLQDPALIASWAGQAKLSAELLDWGYKTLTKWPDVYYKEWGSPEIWYKAMQEKIANPEKLRRIAEEQAIFHKVDHIPMEELIID